MMKKFLNVFGGVLLLGGFIMVFYKEQISYQIFEHPDLVLGATIWCGILILLLVNIEDIVKYHDRVRLSDKEFSIRLIEKEDERNQFIDIKAKSITFELIDCVFFITYLTLTLLGELSFFSFLIFGIAMLFCNIFYLYIKKKLYLDN